MQWSETPCCRFAVKDTPVPLAEVVLKHRMASSLAMLNTEDLIDPKMCRSASPQMRFKDTFEE